MQVVLNCIMDIHRNVFMWGQQDLIKKLKTQGIKAESGKKLTLSTLVSIGTLNKQSVEVYVRNCVLDTTYQLTYFTLLPMRFPLDFV